MARKKKLIQVIEQEPIRLRIGIGEEVGFTKVESLDSYADNSVDAIYSAYHFHRLTKADRWEFMNAAWRVLKVRSPLMLIVPHWSSVRSIADPLAEWPPLCENSFMVYSKNFRVQEQLDSVPLVCNFSDVFGVGYNQDPQDSNGRNDEYITMSRKNKLNFILDIHVTLTKDE